MVHIEGVHQDGSAETAEHLGYDIGNHICPGEGAGQGEANADGRIEVGSGIRTGYEDSGHDRETPRDGDNYPSCAVRLGSLQAYGTAHSVSEQDQYQGP